jgi:pilus assembly protein Flp/PilA
MPKLFFAKISLLQWVMAWVSCLSRGVSTVHFLKNFLKDESGATAIEYGLIAAIVGVGIIAALGGLKNNLSTTFSNVGNKLK